MPKPRTENKNKKVSKNIKKYVKSMVKRNIETKFIDLTPSPDILDPLAANFQQLTASIYQGTNINEISGLKAKLTRLRIKYQLTYDTIIAANPPLTCRIMVIQDNNYSSVPTINIPDMFPNLATMGPASLYNPNLFPTRFKVLYDRRHRLFTFGGEVQVGTINIYKFPRLLQYMSNPLSTVATQQSKGALYLLYFSDGMSSGGTPGHMALIKYEAQLFFKDV